MSMLSDKGSAVRAERHGPAIGNGRQTRAEELRLQLADDIVRGILLPGAGLDETELARRFQVSRTPVRSGPPARGQRPGRGPSRRCGGASERAAPGRHVRGDGAAAHGELRALIHRGDPQPYHEVNEAFHGAIYAGAHNGYLAEITLATRARVQPFRRAQFRNLGRLAKSYQEHDRVVAAILRGDRDSATQAMRVHIVTVGREYEAYVGSL